MDALFHREATHEEHVSRLTIPRTRIRENEVRFHNDLLGWHPSLDKLLPSEFREGDKEIYVTVPGVAQTMSCEHRSYDRRLRA